jgi:hypothetical protein
MHRRARYLASTGMELRFEKPAMGRSAFDVKLIKWWFYPIMKKETAHQIEPYKIQFCSTCDESIIQRHKRFQP